MAPKLNTPQKIQQELVKTIQMHQSGDVQGALKRYKLVLKADPANRAGRLFYGIALNQAGKTKGALKYFDSVLQEAPENKEVYYHMANAYNALDQNDEAIKILDTGLARNPNVAELWSLKGRYLTAIQKYADAMACIDKALQINPNLAEGHMHKGSCLEAVARYEDAMKSYVQAVRLDPSSAKALNHVGALYMVYERYEDAKPWLIKAVEADPSFASAYGNLGVCYHYTSETTKALEYLDKALQLNPKDPHATGNKAGVLRRLGYFEEAVKLFKKSLELAPQRSNIYSNYLMCIHYMDKIEREEIFAAHKEYDRRYCLPLKPEEPVAFENNRSADKPLRVGMVSANLKRHPVGYMILPGLDHHDKTKVSYVGYSDLRKDKTDDFTDRIRENCEIWHDTAGMTDDELIAQIREDEIDLLMDLTGHAEGGGRLRVFAKRAAPVQIEWIGGLFDTSGLSEMDWIIGDHIEIPEGDDEWYTERVYRMPDDYICYEPPHYAPDVAPLPALENGYITFGNLNSPAKTNEYSLKLWADVLKAVPDSKMLFSSAALTSPELRERVLSAFKKNGIGEERLIIESGAPHKDFIKTYNRIDIALDPYPYSGGLTTCEALWLGVPVLALPGPTFAGRHAATHLHNAGYPEWIMDSRQDYIDCAVKWADDLEGLAALRAGMRDKVAASPLVDGKRFAGHIEEAFRFMWKDWLEQKD